MKMPTSTGAFNNSDQKPLGELFFQVVTDDGVVQTIRALDKYWAPRTAFANYLSLISSAGPIKSGAELEEWHYKAECFREDLQFLLTQRHHVFWSYMVYQKTALASIVSFLQRAVPFYVDLHKQNPRPQTITLYQEILSSVIRVICRVITNKESPEAWITKEHLCELIYKNYLISVPMLLDLINAVGDIDLQNVSILKKVFDTLLSIEPKYKEDFVTALSFYKTAFRSIQTQAENEGFEGAGGGEPDDNMETPYDDVALYTLDCAYSLSVLLEVCPSLCALCNDMKLGQSIAHFYDSTIPFLYKNICLITENATSLICINEARVQFLKAFRCIAYSYIDNVLTHPESSLEPSEYFIALLTECLAEQTFVVDYERKYPVGLDVDILKQACKDLDSFKSNFIVEGYAKEAQSSALNTIGSKELFMHLQTDDLEGSIQAIKDPAAVITNGVITESETPVRDTEMDVATVLEVFPDLGIGFIRRVLSRYDTSEEAIAAVLEDNLPPDLANADRSEAYIPPDPQDKMYLETGIKHLNLYDGDEYDVMTQDNPNCIIKQGKGFPNAPKNLGELLDDKRDLEEVRHRYQEYTLVTEDQDEYNDEYDDSYEALLESETRVVKPKGLKEVLGDIEDASEEESEEDGDAELEEDTSSKRDKHSNFCENPEDIRARYEAQRQAKWGNRTDHKNRDVIGEPKGQGQNKTTLINRNKKEKNKSTRSNHNRKAGAAFKRSKGFVPS